MEILSYSLWVTLVMWVFYIGGAINRSAADKHWEVDRNIFLYVVGIPVIAILTEYLLVR